MTKEEIDFLNSRFMLARSSGKTFFNKLFIIAKKLQAENKAQKEQIEIKNAEIKKLQEENEELIYEKYSNVCIVESVEELKYIVKEKDKNND